MTTLLDTLTKTGLDPSTAEVYLILANGGEMTVPQILEKTEVSRATVYDSLDELAAFGAIERRKAGRVAYYKAAHPNTLLTLIDQKKRDMALLEGEMKDTIKTIIGSYNLANQKPGVRFFEGKEGIREVTRDSLRATETIYTFADMEAIDKYASDMNKEYVADRIKLKIPKKLITLDTPYLRNRYKSAPPDARLMEVKFLPGNVSPFKTSMQIYNDTVSYSTLMENKQIGMIITDPFIAQMHRSLFEHLWQTLPSLPAVPDVIPTQ